MTRKEYETICSVLKMSRRSVFAETADSIAKALCVAFDLTGEARKLFLERAGVVD